MVLPAAGAHREFFRGVDGRPQQEIDSDDRRGRTGAYRKKRFSSLGGGGGWSGVYFLYDTLYCKVYRVFIRAGFEQQANNWRVALFAGNMKWRVPVFDK